MLKDGKNEHYLAQLVGDLEVPYCITKYTNDRETTLIAIRNENGKATRYVPPLMLLLLVYVMCTV